MDWLKRNWHVVLLAVLVVFLFVRVNALENRLGDAEGLADDALIKTRIIEDTARNTDNSDQVYDLDTRFTDLESNLKDFIDCMELWALGSGFMKKSDIYFCAASY